MKKLINKIAVSMAIMVSIVACDDVLDQDVAGQLPADEFFKTEQDAQMAVIGIYDALGNLYNQDWGCMYLIRQLPSDESNAGGGDSNDQAPYQQLDDFIHDSQNAHIETVWTREWIGINRSNQVVNKVQATSDVTKRLIAEAKVLRAYFYLDLVSFWGDVPVVTDDLQPSQYKAVQRSPKADVYALIEKDLTEAIPDLPSTYTGGDKFRVAKGTAKALLGKAHLYQKEWAAAATQFEEVITSNVYKLLPSVSAVFSEKGEFGAESLLETSYVSTQAYNWVNYPWGKNLENNIIVQLMGPRGDYYKPAKLPVADTLIAGWGFNTPTEKLFNAYVNSGDATRRRETVMSQADLKARGGDWTEPNFWDYEGVIRRKYGSFSNQTAPAGGSSTPELNYTTNWRLLRYADVLLMAAEANYRNTAEGKAQGYLNQVRQRPGTNLPAIFPTGDALFKAIVNERNLELAFEGHRFVDLVRWDLAAQELAGDGFIAGKHELLPIPNSDVTAAGYKQNDGF